MWRKCSAVVCCKRTRPGIERNALWDFANDQRRTTNDASSLPANILTDHNSEVAFGGLAECVVMRGFFADHETPAAIAGVKPFRGRAGRTARAIEAHAGTHLDERSALRKLRGIFVVHTHQRDPLISLKLVNGADGDRVSGLGLPDCAPVAGGEENETHGDHRRQHNGGEDEEGFFHCFRVISDALPSLLPNSIPNSIPNVTPAGIK